MRARSLALLLGILSALSFTACDHQTAAADSSRDRQTNADGPKFTDAQKRALTEAQEAVRKMKVADKCVIDIRPGDPSNFPDPTPNPYEFLVMVTHIIDTQGTANPDDDILYFQVHSRNRYDDAHDNEHKISSVLAGANKVRVDEDGPVVAYSWRKSGPKTYLEEKVASENKVDFAEVANYSAAVPLEVLSFHPAGADKCDVRFTWRGAAGRFRVYWEP